MEIWYGLFYNFKGLFLGMKTGKLLFWGIVRFAVVVMLTILSAGLILAHHGDLLDLLWHQPNSPWVHWLWHVFSWILALFLVGLAALIAYLASQILFSVIIMDRMSRITEEKITGTVIEPSRMQFLTLAFFLMRQEIPRAAVPFLISFSLMVLGWVMPLGSILILLSWASTAVFLAWDNTDLVPSRRFAPFRARLRLLLRTIPFHLGFGIPFLIPGLNILFLSFAPVGATLYQVERVERKGHPEGRRLLKGQGHSLTDILA